MFERRRRRICLENTLLINIKYMELTQTIDLLKNRKSALQGELQAIELAISTLEATYQPELKVIENANKQIETLQIQKDSLENEKEAIIAEKEAIKAQKETLEAQLADVVQIDTPVKEVPPAPVIDDVPPVDTNDIIN